MGSLGLFLVAPEAAHERRQIGIHLVLARADEREIALEERVEDEPAPFFGGFQNIGAPERLGQLDGLVKPYPFHRLAHFALVPVRFESGVVARFNF